MTVKITMQVNSTISMTSDNYKDRDTDNDRDKDNTFISIAKSCLVFRILVVPSYLTLVYVGDGDS
jgi:hypothetical protein